MPITRHKGSVKTAQESFENFLNAETLFLQKIHNCKPYSGRTVCLTWWPVNKPLWHISMIRLHSQLS